MTRWVEGRGRGIPRGGAGHEKDWPFLRQRVIPADFKGATHPFSAAEVTLVSAEVGRRSRRGARARRW